MNKLLNIRVGLLVAAMLLAAFGVSNGFVALFYQSKHEVAYNFDVVAVYCSQGNCAYSARLTVANTGKKVQERVSITITGLPPGIGGSSHITNFSAAEPRTADPLIEQDYKDGTGNIRLANLTPGALVEFTFAGFFPEDQKPADDATRVEVIGRGKIIKADPRAITFGRYIS